jgi:histidinol-phosphate/aromatic aminotransferase/cobyric acid decarboxylase-like protein
MTIGDLNSTNLGWRRNELPELTLIDDLDDLSKAYQVRHGRAPIHVSHWDPSKEVTRDLSEYLPKLSYENPVPYTYSYLLKRRPHGLNGILRKLGFEGKTVGAQVVENGTNAIAAVANWLKVTEIKEVVLLRPFYFVVPYNLSRLGIRVREVDLDIRDGKYALPSDLGLGHGQALWITHPVYSTGAYTMSLHISELRQIADSGAVVVADEALVLPQSAIALALGGHPNFIGIYTPHKAVCINSLKFSAIVYHPSTGDTFDHWSDILSGGLSLSAAAATEHFISEEYERYRVAFLDRIELTRRWHSSTLRKLGPGIRTDAPTRGHFITTYFPLLDAELGRNIGYLAELMEDTGVSFIPGIRSGVNKSLGLSFRINLAQDNSTFRDALSNLYEVLIQRSCLTPRMFG